MKVMEELGVEDREGTHARWVRYVNEYEEGPRSTTVSTACSKRCESAV